MATEQIQGPGYNTPPQNNYSDYTSRMQREAEKYGITIPVKEDGSIDLALLKREIDKQKRSENSVSMTTSESDEFVTTKAGITDTVKNTKKAENCKDTISSEYKNEALKYEKYMNFNTTETTQETELQQLWNDVKESEFRLTKIGTTNQTVIEGLSSFIQKLTGAVEASKDYQASVAEGAKEETVFSLETQQDIQNTKNKIEAHEADAEDNILGNNPFMKSAFETSEYEKEEMAV